MRTDLIIHGRDRPQWSGGPARRWVAITWAALVVMLLVVGAAPAATAAEDARTGAAKDAAQGREGPASLDTEDVDAWLDGLMPAALETAGIAGGAVSVVKDGEILTARGYGTTDVQAERDGLPSPVDPEQTLFRTGSVSKVFTATAVMQLVEQGDIDLDTDVSQYLDFEIPREFDTPITMRHLLTHTPGFEERVRGLIQPADTEVDLRKDLVDNPPPEQIYEPGTTPAYSNYGYSLAGYIVEQVSGVPFEEYLQQNVLEPAGMTSSTFEQPLPEELAGRLSQGYPDSSQPAVPFEVINAVPAGGLTSSATDMGKFMLAQLGQLPEGQSLLEPDTRELMQQPGLDAESLGALAQGPRMTLGLFDESQGGHRILGHGGDTNVFHSHMQLYPDDGVGIFVTLNSTGPTGTETLDLRNTLLDGFADRYFPGGPDPAVQPTAAEHAALAEGTYASSRTMDSTFIGVLSLIGQTQVAAQNDGTIRITPAPGGADPAVFAEVQPWVWQEVDGHRVLTMQVEDEDVVAIGHDSAFTLLPAQVSQTTALTVVGSSALVLAISLLALPTGAVLRRRYAAPAPFGRPGRVARVLTRSAALLTLLALAGWGGTITVALEQDVPALALRALQAVQLFGLLGVVPAAMVCVAAVRGRKRWWRLTGAVLVLLSLAGVGWFALTFRLLSPSVSY